MMRKLATKAILAVLLAACTVSMNASLNEDLHQKAQPAIDIDTEKAAVKAVLERYIKAFQTRNREGVAEVYAHDEDLVVFGSNPLDRRVGWKMTQAYIDKYFTSVDRIEIGLKDQRIKVHRSGEAAWFSEVLSWKEVEKGKTFVIEGLRISGVLERRDGRWVIVQLHASGPEPSSY
ncbi:MAG: nuclear transport factor 2 family protein [Candidatus Aminicenantes bacterium]|nr:nuclear transport factor 2 family protein [Candidatus Aminicenantes bacterium]